MIGNFFWRVDGLELLRREWMFKLVGKETFTIGKTGANCVVKIEPVGGFAYQYSMEVNGKPYKTFAEQQSKVQRQPDILHSWIFKTLTFLKGYENLDSSSQRGNVSCCYGKGYPGHMG